ncbi:MAG: hypothetical protein ACE5IW_04125 [bacterium]
MYSILKSHTKTVAEKLGNRFRKGVTTRSALGISIFLHIFIGMAFASFLAGKYYVEHVTDSASIEFDLVTETDVKFENDNNKSNPTDQLLGQKLQDFQKNGFNGTESSAAGRESSSSKPNTRNEQVVLASLASLSDLRESFNFIMQQVAADSAAGFSPIHGEAPETEFYTAGSNDGTGLGHGSGIRILIGGGGYCPPSHGR